MLARPDEAADEADRMVKLRTDRADDLIDAARLLARAAGAVEGSRAETYAGRALERLAAPIGSDRARSPCGPTTQDSPHCGRSRSSRARSWTWPSRMSRLCLRRSG